MNELLTSLQDRSSNIDRDKLRFYSEEVTNLLIIRSPMVKSVFFDLSNLEGIEQRILRLYRSYKTLRKRISTFECPGESGWIFCETLYNIEINSEFNLPIFVIKNCRRQEDIHVVVTAISILDKNISNPYLIHLFESSRPLCHRIFSEYLFENPESLQYFKTYILRLYEGIGDVESKFLFRQAIVLNGFMRYLPRSLLVDNENTATCIFVKLSIAKLNNSYSLIDWEGYFFSKKISIDMLEIASIVVERSRMRLIISELCRDNKKIQFGIYAIGLMGDVNVVPWLVDKLSDAKLSRISTFSLMAITGIDMREFKADKKLIDEVDYDLQGLNIDLDELLNVSEIPIIDRDMFDQYWKKNRSNYDGEKRYFFGKILNQLDDHNFEFGVGGTIKSRLHNLRLWCENKIENFPRMKKWQTSLF